MPGVLAIDAGNSKTDVAIVAPDGSVLGIARGRGFPPASWSGRPRGGGAGSAGRRGRRAPASARTPERPLVEHVSACLANADLPTEQQRLEQQIRGPGLGRVDLRRQRHVRVAARRRRRPPGVAVVCGAGINCSGLLPDGRIARFAAVGKISGDWGGGDFLAEEAMWWASRADDGRGPATRLALALPAHFGLSDMAAAVEAIHLGIDLPTYGCSKSRPLLFRGRGRGDEVATAVVRAPGRRDRHARRRRAASPRPARRAGRRRPRRWSPHRRAPPACSTPSTRRLADGHRRRRQGGSDASCRRRGPARPRSHRRRPCAHATLPRARCGSAVSARRGLEHMFEYA